MSSYLVKPTTSDGVFRVLIPVEIARLGKWGEENYVRVKDVGTNQIVISKLKKAVPKNAGG